MPVTPCWMLGRSLETLDLRMERANSNARVVAKWLAAHSNGARLHSLALLPKGSPEKAIYDRQCTGVGSTFSFDFKSGEKEAFAFMNALKIFKLAAQSRKFLWRSRERRRP